MASQILTISLNMRGFIIYGFRPPSPWFLPSCFTQNKHGHELRGPWDPPGSSPKRKLGGFPAGALPGHRDCGFLVGVARLLLGVVPALCEAGGDLAAEGLGPGQQSSGGPQRRPPNNTGHRSSRGKATEGNTGENLQEIHRYSLRVRVNTLIRPLGCEVMYVERYVRCLTHSRCLANGSYCSHHCHSHGPRNRAVLSNVVFNADTHFPHLL